LADGQLFKQAKLTFVDINHSIAQSIQLILINSTLANRLPKQYSVQLGIYMYLNQLGDQWSNCQYVPCVVQSRNLTMWVKGMNSYPDKIPLHETQTEARKLQKIERTKPAIVTISHH
jgi:hypothetical protein